MPIYEFVCDSCKQGFEYFILSSRELKNISCPNCGSHQVRKVLSSFSCRSGSASKGTVGTTTSCGSSSGFR